ncbi:MAG: hypothetical protein LBC07_07130 [Elusimicrobiota bacterium]|nr:hypothetical protein [Elusimicrobiota bacterium]
MKNGFKFFLCCVFFLSGAASLAYQIIYIRLAYTYFGVVLPVLSCAVSVFMLGLGIGSYFGGKYIQNWVAKTKLKAVVFYGLAETVIGIGALLVPFLFRFSQKLLLTTGQSDSTSYLFLSAVALTICMLPWCVAMGTTFPFMMSFIREVFSKEKTSFSFLYAANVLGSVFGVLITVIVAIETLGLINSLYVAAAINFLIAATAFFMAKKFNQTFDSGFYENSQNLQPVWNFAKGLDPVSFFKTLPQRFFPFSTELTPPPPPENFLKIILFITGFVSLGLEIAQTRDYTPVLGTNVYAFSFLLAAYLFSTYLGTLLYRRHVKNNKVISLDKCLMFLALSSFLPIIINDPHIMAPAITGRLLKHFIQIALTIAPMSAILGYLTPAIIDFYSLGDAKKQGKAYAINVAGCILGPLIVSYILLPLISAKSVMIFMACLYILLFLFSYKNIKRRFLQTAYGIIAVFLIIACGYSKSYELFFPPTPDEAKSYARSAVFRDYASTTFASNAGGGILLVNGMGMTSKTTITKIMAHFPIALHRDPQNGLVLCFGMGTSFRSMMSWGIKTTVVDLNPGVIKAFPIFFDDAQEFLTNPMATIVVDDARRFIMRTNEKFDVVVIDPPPPVFSAGSALLYSKEFYEILKTKMTQTAVLQTWIPYSYPNNVVRAVAASLMQEFPYVKFYTSIEGWGVHLIASMSPIDDLTSQEIIAKMPSKAQTDLMEWLPSSIMPQYVFDVLLSHRIEPDVIMWGRKKDEVITDAHPYNEYWLLRGTANR